MILLPLPTLLAALAVAQPVETSTPAADLPVAESEGVSLAEMAAKMEALNDSVSQMQSVVDVLSKIKVSGYIQGRYEYREDSANGLNAAGRPATTSQFLVRRGRLKTTYAGDIGEFMLQIDATNRGVVLKDAEATFIEPWSGWGIRLTAGQFKWPFGYEVLQSSGAREMPERARVIRALFPGERDRGFRLQINHPSGAVKFAAAIVNGNGTEDAIYTSNDQNRMKDFVARLGLDLKWLTAGVSGYIGESLLTRLGNPNAMPPTETTIGTFRKSRIGADAAVYFDVPSVGGLALKGEFIMGEENGADALGFWVLAVQNLGSSLGVFTRLDRYDPDRNKDNNAIMTIGGGAHYFFSGNVKATATFEHIMSQTAEGASDPKDDIFTLQIQAMF